MGACASCSGKGEVSSSPPSYPPLSLLLNCRGAFSYLRRVTEKSTRLDFAAKFIPGRTKAKQSARRELHILSQLDHERIVFFHDAFEKKNAVIMVMELYPLGTAPWRHSTGRGEAFGENRWADWVQRSCVGGTIEHGISMLLD